jgi:hypothetical protein
MKGIEKSSIFNIACSCEAESSVKLIIYFSKSCSILDEGAVKIAFGNKNYSSYGKINIMR